jgi:hypothetical protein
MNSTQGANTFVKLATASGLTEADTWKAVLEAAGISVHLRHDIVNVIPETAGEIASVDLWVPKDQAVEAMEILQDERVEANAEDEPA